MYVISNWLSLFPLGAFIDTPTFPPHLKVKTRFLFSKTQFPVVSTEVLQPVRPAPKQVAGEAESPEATAGVALYSHRVEAVV